MYVCMYVCMYVRIFPKNFRQRYYLFLIYANFFVGKCKNNAFERFYKSYLLCAQPNSPASPERRGEAMSSGHRGRGREGKSVGSVISLYRDSKRNVCFG